MTKLESWEWVTLMDFSPAGSSPSRSRNQILNPSTYSAAEFQVILTDVGPAALALVILTAAALIQTIIIYLIYKSIYHEILIITF